MVIILEIQTETKIQNLCAEVIYFIPLDQENVPLDGGQGETIL